MAFPKYYLFDASLPGSVRLVFDDHVMHSQNFREHLEGFVTLPDPTFDVMGVWKEADVLLYMNGLPNRMRDGLVWLTPKATRSDFAAWLAKVQWPTDEKTMATGVLLPGRWLEEEEAARFWLSLQGIKPTSKKGMLDELKRHSVPLHRFSEHRKTKRAAAVKRPRNE